jgi:hypothetical protein
MISRLNLYTIPVTDGALLLYFLDNIVTDAAHTTIPVIRTFVPNTGQVDVAILACH